MSEWYGLAAYCGGCETWSDSIPHVECAQGPAGSALALDPDEFLLTCGKCHEVWLIEDTEALCSTCGYVQSIEMRDDDVQLEAEGRLLAADGPIVYILRHAGPLLITHRGCISSGPSSQEGML